jgi:hypothetical protein
VIRSWRPKAAAALAALALGAAGLAGAQPAAAAPETDGAAAAAAEVYGWYEIKNANSGMNLGIYDSSTANGGKVAQWTDEVPNFRGNPDQMWYLDTDFNGVTHIMNGLSKKYMAVATPRTDNWAKIIQWSFSGNADQLWAVENVGADLYQIRNGGSNKCLAMSNASTARGTQAVQYTCNGGRDQKWRLQYVIDQP